MMTELLDGWTVRNNYMICAPKGAEKGGLKDD